MEMSFIINFLDIENYVFLRLNSLNMPQGEKELLIIKNLNYSDGGISIPAIFGALAVNFIVNAISNPLSEILTNLFIR